MFSFILDSGDAQASTARTSTKEVPLESPAKRLPNFLSILDEETCLKGILLQKIFYRLNLIFWIVMGCGIARFSRRGLKTTET